MLSPTRERKWVFASVMSVDDVHVSVCVCVHTHACVCACVYRSVQCVCNCKWQLKSVTWSTLKDGTAESCHLLRNWKFSFSAHASVPTYILVPSFCFSHVSVCVDVCVCVYRSVECVCKWQLKSVTWSALKDGTAQLCHLLTRSWKLQLSFSQLWDGMMGQSMGQNPINEGRQMASKIKVIKIGQYTVFPGKQAHWKFYHFRLEQY